MEGLHNQVPGRTEDPGSKNWQGSLQNPAVGMISHAPTIITHSWVTPPKMQISNRSPVDLLLGQGCGTLWLIVSPNPQGTPERLFPSGGAVCSSPKERAVTSPAWLCRHLVVIGLLATGTSADSLFAKLLVKLEYVVLTTLNTYLITKRSMIYSTLNDTIIKIP